MASKQNWQKHVAQIIYHAYPDSDLLPIDPPAEGETIRDFAVRAQGAGDTLFLFICREASDDIDADEYLHRLDRALRDIEQLRAAFADHLFDAASNPAPEGSLP